MPHKVWAVGEEVLAADFQSYLQDQAVVQFPNVAARNTWAAPPKGALCVVADSQNFLWVYSGSAWQLVDGQCVSHVENSSEVGWTAASAVVCTTTQAVTTVGGQRYQIAIDLSWRGTVLNDVHQFELVRGDGPGGDFTSSTMMRTWAISPARASVSGSSEHFHATYVFVPGVVITNQWRIQGRRLGGTGSAYVVLATFDMTTRRFPGTA